MTVVPRNFEFACFWIFLVKDSKRKSKQIISFNGNPGISETLIYGTSDNFPYQIISESLSRRGSRQVLHASK